MKVKELVRNSCIFEIHCCYYHHLWCHSTFTVANIENTKTVLVLKKLFFQFFSCWKFSILHRLAEEEELRKIGAFDGRRMSEYAQCWPLLGKRQEILYKLYKILGKKIWKENMNKWLLWTRISKVSAPPRDFAVFWQICRVSLIIQININTINTIMVC